MAEAAFFDLDKTVIASASMVAFGRRFYDEGLLSRRTLARAVWGQLVYLQLGASEAKLAKVRQAVLALTKGWEQERVRAIVEDALGAVVEPLIYAEALELMAAHREAGRRVVIVSASPAEVVEPIGRLLGVDDVIASRAEVVDGRYTGDMASYAYGALKVVAMRELADREDVDLDGSWAYSDSTTDLPMLEAVGHPVAVNPDRPLAKAARERGWEVLEFRRPVRLRDRLPARAAPMTAVVLGVGALAAGAVLWWRLAGGSPPATPSAPPPAAVSPRPAAAWRRRPRGRPARRG